MTEQEKVNRKTAAERLLTDPLFAEAFTALDAQLYSKFKDPGLTEDDMTRLWLSVQISGKIKAWFEGVISAGKVAEYNLMQEKNRQ